MTMNALISVRHTISEPGIAWLGFWSRLGNLDRCDFLTTMISLATCVFEDCSSEHNMAMFSSYWLF